MKKAILCSLLAAMLAMTACGKTETPGGEVSGVTTEATEQTTIEETAATTTVTEATTTEAEVTESEETEAPETSAPAEETASGDSKAADDFMNMLNSKKLYMEAYTEADGITANLTVAMDMEQNAYVNMDLAGFKIVMLSNESGSYLIDDASKTYFASDSTSVSTETLTTQSFEKTGSGTGTLDGADCEYVQYDIVNTDGENGVYKIYWKDGKVLAVETDGSVMKIKKYSADIPAGMFKIPDGYTEKDPSEMFSME